MQFKTIYYSIITFVICCATTELTAQTHIDTLLKKKVSKENKLSELVENSDLSKLNTDSLLFTADSLLKNTSLDTTSQSITSFDRELIDSISNAGTPIDSSNYYIADSLVKALKRYKLSSDNDSILNQSFLSKQNNYFIDSLYKLNQDSLKNYFVDSLNRITKNLEAEQNSSATKTAPPPPPSKEIILTRADSIRVEYFVKELDSLSLGALYDVDTVLDRFQDYDPLKLNPHFYETLGNIGLPANSKIFEVDDKISFDQRTNYIDELLYSYNTTKYYKLINSYSELKYANGGQKEQLFRVIHSQNFFQNRVNMGLDFRFIHSPGIYRRAFSDDKGITFYARYSTLNKRYGVLANYTHNKLRWQESGGISDKAQFDDNTEANRRIIPINIADASSEVKTGSIFINQYFNIGGSPRMVKDTTGQWVEKRPFNFGRISHEFLIQNVGSLYEDTNPLSDFYKPYAIPVDPLFTKDTNHIRTISNELKWSNLNYEEKPEDKTVYYYAGMKHEYNEINGLYEKRIYSQFAPEAGFSLKVLKSFYLNVDASYVFGGFNEDNYYLKAKLSQYLGTKNKNIGQLNFYGKVSHYSPSWFYQEYHGNNFDWKNNFGIQEHILLRGEYKFKGISAGVDLNYLDNYIYLNEDVQPVQATEGLSVLKIYLREKFNIGAFTIDSYLVYQKPSNENIIRVPDFIGNMSVYATFDIFQHAATLQPGFEVTYNTEYYADKYMPALRSFYLQNEEKIGNYPYVDLFIQMKLKRFRIFVKYDHLNGLLQDTRYYGTPLYPYQDAILKYGLSWIFHN